MMVAFGFLCFLFASCLFRMIHCYGGGGTWKPLHGNKQEEQEERVIYDSSREEEFTRSATK